MPIIKYRAIDSHQDYYMIETSQKLSDLEDPSNSFDREGKIVDANYYGRKYCVINITRDFTDHSSTIVNIASFALIIATFGTILFSENFRSLRNQKSYTCLLAPKDEKVDINTSTPHFFISEKLCEDVEQLVIQKLDPYSIHRLLMTKPNLPKRIEFLWRELFKNPVPHLYKRTLDELRKIYFHKIIQFSQVIDELRVSGQLTELFFEPNEWKIIFKICPNIKKITYQSDYFPEELPKNLESLQQIRPQIRPLPNLPFSPIILWYAPPINISSWPSTLQTLSLSNFIEPQSLSKLPPSLTSLDPSGVDLSCDIELPPSLTYFNYPFAPGLYTFKLPTTLTALELNRENRLEKSVDLILRFSLPHLTKLRMTKLDLSDSKVQFPENLKSLDLGLIYNSSSENYSYPDSLTFLRIRSSSVPPNFRMTLPSALISLNIHDSMEVSLEEFLQRPNIISLAMHSLEPTYFQELPTSLSLLKIFNASILQDTDISLLPQTLLTLRLDRLVGCTEDCIKNLPPSLTKLTLTNLLRSKPGKFEMGMSELFRLSVADARIVSKFLTFEDLKFLPKSLTSLKISTTSHFALRQWGKMNLSCRWKVIKSQD